MGLRHQDAHEFLNYLINEIADTLRRDAKRLARETRRLTNDLRPVSSKQNTEYRIIPPAESLNN